MVFSVNQILRQPFWRGVLPEVRVCKPGKMNRTPAATAWIHKIGSVRPINCVQCRKYNIKSGHKFQLLIQPIMSGPDDEKLQKVACVLKRVDLMLCVLTTHTHTQKPTQHNKSHWHEETFGDDEFVYYLDW